MITERDQSIINHLKNVGETNAKDLHELFFNDVSEHMSRKRLKLLCDRGHIKRRKDIDDRFYIYFVEVNDA